MAGLIFLQLMQLYSVTVEIFDGKFTKIYHLYNVFQLLKQADVLIFQQHWCLMNSSTTCALFLMIGHTLV
jgi:hypothetical protein